MKLEGIVDMGIACTECFTNFGFRQVVMRHAKIPLQPCPQCSRTAKLIDHDGLVSALHQFFVQGSYVPETLAPVYQMNRFNPRPTNFDRTLENDALLGCQLTGEVIFEYGPPLWRIGEVDLKHEFDVGGSVMNAAATRFVASGPKLTLPMGSQLFRIRKNPGSHEILNIASAFDAPPAHVKRQAGRWDDGISDVLYASDDIELCLHECRVQIADEVVVATLTTQKPLILLDLSTDFEDRGMTEFEDPNIFARFLSLSRHSEWLSHARTVAAAAKREGLDGIRYTSYYAQAKSQSQALNVALFGFPIRGRILELDSINRLRINDARYEFSFGPALMT